MRIRRLLPAPEGEVEAADLVDALLAAPTLPPFAPPLVQACAGLSAAILAHPRARQLPALVALAWSLRPAALRALQARHREEEGDTLRVPRGLVLHLPPGNVDTLAFSTWALSLLAGNRNLVRISSRGGEAAALLIALWAEVLAAGPPAVAQGNAAVATDHDPAAIAALSARVDARLAWGGDATVRAIRQRPLAPRALDLAFPDRWSWSLWSTEAWRALDAAGRQRLVEAFADDLAWFDQQACASPRLLVWVGEDGAACGAALRPLLAAALRQRGFGPSGGLLLDRLDAAFAAALDPGVVEVHDLAGPLTTLRLSETAAVGRDRAGVGLLQELCLPTLGDLGELVQRKDQTVTTFGFSAETLRALARQLNGQGVDRFVPVGEALRFEAVWDGVDLLDLLTRRVTVRVATRGAP